MKLTREYLESKGWKQRPDGTWSRDLSAQVVSCFRNEPSRALVSEAPKVKGSFKRVAGQRTRKRAGVSSPVVVVTLVALRRRLIDEDNLAGGFKSLRDAIALSLGVDDADKRVRWETGQVESHRTGTLVCISMA